MGVPGLGLVVVGTGRMGVPGLGLVVGRMGVPGLGLVVVGTGRMGVPGFGFLVVPGTGEVRFGPSAPCLSGSIQGEGVCPGTAGRTGGAGLAGGGFKSFETTPFTAATGGTTRFS